MSALPSCFVIPNIPGAPMTDAAETYRKLAAKARSDAAAASLPNVRQLHLRSAERLDEIISGIHSVSQAKLRNEEAKRQSMAS